MNIWNKSLAAMAGAVLALGVSATPASALVFKGGTPATAVVFDFEALDFDALAGDELELTVAGHTVRFSGVGLQIRGAGGAIDADSGHTKYLSTVNDSEEITVELLNFTAGAATIQNPLNSDRGGEIDSITGTAFDSLDNVIAGPTDDDTEFFTLAALGIAKLTYDDTNDGTGYLLAQIEFSRTSIDGAVPLPAALPLMAAGLGAFGFMGWRRKRAA